MRLLDTTSLDIVSVAADKTPPYAILSHTWGAEVNEPTLQQIQELTQVGRLDPSAWTRHPTALKKGYQKIRSACGLALAQGYRYLWADTCCIDKTSSAELSEAINSMFKWYQAAGICYVYLEDVDVGANIVNPDVSRCRWFSRGWTLQELVAPANVVFYDYKWAYIGNKRDGGGFQVQLSRTTGIDARVLSGAVDLEDLSVACRMSWAASRTTSRPEDIAYCLIGIFQVNMPLLYGEGSRAFIRLQEEILRTTDDQSLFAWKCPPGAEESRRLEGLLSPTPLYFRETGHIKPSTPDVSRISAPSTSTNAGLHVQLFLRPINVLSVLAGGEYVDSFLDFHSDRDLHTDFIAVLDCDTISTKVQSKPDVTEKYLTGIRLVALGSGQYARVRSDKLVMTPNASADEKSTGGASYVYVKQKPAWIFPAIVVDSLVMGKDSSQTPHELVDVYPLARWDRGIKTLKAGRSRQSYVAGAFRYKVTESSTTKESASFLDVIVLISQIEAQLGNWNGSCLCNRATPGTTLQQEYERISKLEWSELSELSRGAGPKKLKNNTQFGLTPCLEKLHRGQRNLFLLRLAEGDTNVAELDGSDVLEVTTAWTTENVLNNRSEMDHLSALRKRLASEIIDDSFDLTIRQTVNLSTRRSSKIRTIEHVGWFSNAQTDLMAIMERVRACCTEVHVLSEDGGKLDSFEQYFSNKLVTACIEGDLETAKELVRTRLVPVSLETKSFSETFPDRELGPNFLAFTPIHWAALFGYKDIVRLLSLHGANKYSKTLNGFTTLHLAALMQHRDLLKYLLDDWSDNEICSVNLPRHGELHDSPAHFEAAYGMPSIGAGTLPKIMLAQELPGDPQKATNNIRNGLWETPLHRAASMNNSQAISAMRAALNITDWQLEAIDAFKRTPLWHGAAAGATDAVQTLLGLSATVDAPDMYGRTPLHIACREGQVDTARLLLQAGADVNRLTTAPCLSPCHFAALSKNLACLELVIKHGGDPTLSKFEGLDLGAIHIAAANGWLDGVRLLVEKGCDPTTTCSHIVIATGRSQLDDGVEVARVPGRNAMELASRGGHGDVVEFLEKYALASRTE